MAKTDLTFYAAQGYEACANGQDKSPFISSSPCDIAWRVGFWLKETGRSAPRRVSMSRGYSVNVNDMKCQWLSGSQFERLS